MKNTLLKNGISNNDPIPSASEIKAMETQPATINNAELRIVGRNTMQNELLVTFLKKRTGFECNHFLSFDMPISEVLKENHSVFFLLDSKCIDINELWNKLNNRLTPKNSSKIIFALFNLDPDNRIEFEAVDHGVRGLFFNNEPLEIIPKGIKAILAGEMWYPRKILSKYIRDTNNNKYKELSTELKANLTKREREILLKIFSGKSNQEISDELCISYHTVKTHLYNIYRKINTPDRFQAMLWAAKHL